MRTRSGEHGLVPVNYIDKLDTEQEKQADKTDGPSATSQSNGPLVDPVRRLTSYNGSYPDITILYSVIIIFITTSYGSGKGDLMMYWDMIKWFY